MSGARRPVDDRTLLLLSHRGLSSEDWKQLGQRIGSAASGPERAALHALTELRSGDPALGATLTRAAAAELQHDPALLHAFCAAAATMQTIQGRWADAAWTAAAGHRAMPQPRAHRESPAAWQLAAVEVAIEWHTYAGATRLGGVLRRLRELAARNLLDDRHASAMLAVASVQFGIGDFSEAAGWTSRALRLLPPASDRAIAARAQFALIRQRQGQWHEAFRLAEAGRDLLSDDTNEKLRGIVEATALLKPALELDLPATQPELARLSNHVERHYSVQADVVLGQIRSILFFALEDWQGLLSYLDGLDDLGYRSIYSAHERYAMRAAALWNLHWVNHYRACIEAWGAEAGAEQSPYYWTHRALLAEVEGDRTAYAAHRARAESFVDSILDPMGRTWIHLATGYIALRRGSTQDGLAEWELARERMRRAGADSFARLFTAVLERTAGEFAEELGDPLAPLTAQQRIVAELVAQGLTSGEIAARIHLSSKTIDFHVANIVTRLGLRSRREIRGVIEGR